MAKPNPFAKGPAGKGPSMGGMNPFSKSGAKMPPKGQKKPMGSKKCG